MITLPTPYKNEIRRPHKENWLVRLYNSSGNYVGVALDEITDDTGDFYYGAILNKPSIRESINLLNSTSSTSNVSLTLANFTYNGSDFSKEILFGSYNYVNQDVKIYSRVSDSNSSVWDQVTENWEDYHFDWDEAEDDKVLLYTGRLTSVSHDHNTIKLSTNAKMPWDDISVPNTFTTSTNIPVPVSYGNFTRNSASTYTSPQFVTDLTSKSYRPLKFSKIDQKFALYVDGKSSATEAELATHNKENDVFVPFQNAESASINTDGSHHGKIEAKEKRSFKYRADSHSQVSKGNEITVNNIANTIDNNDSTYGDFAFDETMANISSTIKYEFNVNHPSGKNTDEFVALKNTDSTNVLLDGGINSSTTSITVDDSTNLELRDVIRINTEQMVVTNISGTTLTVDRGFNETDAESHNNNTGIFVNNTASYLYIKYGIDITTNMGNLSDIDYKFSTDGSDSGILTTTTTVSDAFRYINIAAGTDMVSVYVRFRADDTGGMGSLTAEFRIYDIQLISKRVVEEPEEITYIASDGLDRSYSSGTASLIHEAHRDLLHRNTTLDLTTDPTGWSDLDTDRSGWNIRYWELEPKSLKNMLNKLAYEGGFIYRLKGSDQTIQYIHLPDSPSFDHTLTKDDIDKVNISHTSFNSLITKIEYEYEKHPAANRYISTATHTNSTTRTNYNIGTEDNVKKIKLDALTDNITAGSGANASHGNYYDEIYGKVRVHVSCDVVNDEIGYAIEVGDFIDFSSMPVEPFNANFSSNYYIVTQTNRSPGRTSIKCIEVADTSGGGGGGAKEA